MAAEFLGALGMSLALLVAGRVILSMLPAGSAGSHRAGELPLTLALSAVLGIAGVVVPSLWLERCGVTSVWGPAIFWTIVPLLRWWTRPHGFVPRRAWAESETAASKAVLCAVFAMCSWPIARAAIDGLEPSRAMVRCAGLAAAAAFILHGLGQARRAPIGRRLVVLFLLATPALQGNLDAVGLAALIAAAMGASFLVAWLRRGDERAAVLSAIGFALLAPFSGLASIAGVAVLVIATHASARLRVAIASAAAIAVAATVMYRVPLHYVALDDPTGTAFVDAAIREEPSLLGALAQWQLWGIFWIVLGFALTAFAAGVRGGRIEPTPERPGRELVSVVAVLLATLALHVIAGRAGGLEFIERRVLDTEQMLAMSLPAATLIVGLVLAPSEIGLRFR